MADLADLADLISAAVSSTSRRLSKGVDALGADTGGTTGKDVGLSLGVPALPRLTFPVERYLCALRGVVQKLHGDAERLRFI